MKTHKNHILRCLKSTKKAQTLEDIYKFIADIRRVDVKDLGAIRKQNIVQSLMELTRNRKVICKTFNDGETYWALDKNAFSLVGAENTAVPLKDLVKRAVRNQRPIRSFMG